MDESSCQSHLGPSPNNVLAIIDLKAVRLQNTRDYQPTGPAFIFQLPDELIASIVQLAIFESFHPDGCPDCRFTPNAKCAKALSHVCRRISRIAQPMLFHTIKFQGTPSMVPPKKPVIRLYNILRQNPSLRQHCRRLSVSVSDFAPTAKPEDYYIAKNLAQWLTRVRCLQNYGGFEGNVTNPHTWSLIRKLAQNMRDVRHWSVNRESWGLYLQQVMKEVAFTKLTKLELHGISELKSHSLQLDSKACTSSAIPSRCKDEPKYHLFDSAEELTGNLGASYCTLHLAVTIRL